MSHIVDRVYQIIQSLPEAKAMEILDVAEFVKAREKSETDDFSAMAWIWARRHLDQDMPQEQTWSELEA